jgi:hypothetical protein
MVGDEEWNEWRINAVRKHRNQTSIPDSELKRAANALRKAGNGREAKRLERNLPAKEDKRK